MGSDMLITSFTVSKFLIVIVFEQAQPPVSPRGMLFGQSFSFSRLRRLPFCSGDRKVDTTFTVGQPRTNELMASVLPSPTSSTQLAAHKSLNFIFVFLLMLLLYLILTTTNQSLNRKRCPSRICGPLLSSTRPSGSRALWGTGRVTEMHGCPHQQEASPW